MHHRRLRVRLETNRHIIEGTLQLPSEGYRSRMTDFLNSHDSDFLPVTEAKLTWIEASRPPERREYVAVSVRQIVLAVELESLGTFDATGGPPAEPLLMSASTPPPAGGPDA
ncbi:MAG TPA: hypothetical protein VD836_09285 [Solirubrobacteraceae bacterium]|jgi:hypothetical protein|nr:hypothetical protein [Solirubrobacteraceae bacterium]